MIKVKFLNSEIALAISTCFQVLSPRCQVHLADKYQSNNADNFEQEIEIGSEDLLIIYRSVGQMAQGEIGNFPSTLKGKLVPILGALAQKGNESALEVINKVQEIDAFNEVNKLAKQDIGK